MFVYFFIFYRFFLRLQNFCNFHSYKNLSVRCANENFESRHCSTSGLRSLGKFLMQDIFVYTLLFSRYLSRYSLLMVNRNLSGFIFDKILCKSYSFAGRGIYMENFDKACSLKIFKLIYGNDLFKESSNLCNLQFSKTFPKWNVWKTYTLRVVESHFFLIFYSYRNRKNILYNSLYRALFVVQFEFRRVNNYIFTLIQLNITFWKSEQIWNSRNMISPAFLDFTSQ